MLAVGSRSRVGDSRILCTVWDDMVADKNGF